MTTRHYSFINILEYLLLINILNGMLRIGITCLHFNIISHVGARIRISDLNLKKKIDSRIKSGGAVDGMETRKSKKL